MAPTLRPAGERALRTAVRRPAATGATGEATRGASGAMEKGATPAASDLPGPVGPSHCDCIVLAAGLASRMNQNKLLLPVDGVPMIHRVVQAAISACRRVIVVLGHEAERIRAVLGAAPGSTDGCSDAGRAAGPAPLVFTTNGNYHAGMFSSIRAGMRLIETPWFFVLPGDLPFVESCTFHAVTQGPAKHLTVERPPGAGADATDPLQARAADVPTAGAGGPVAVVPTFKGRRGHPVLLSSRLVPEVLSLPPEAGPMRNILAGHPTIVVELDSPGICRDVDTPEDYEQL